MKIKIEELKQITTILFKSLEEKGVAEIELQKDYYWWIQKELKYEIETQPSDFTVGQLSDDFQELKKIQNGDNEPIGYAFVWLSTLLAYLGEITP